MNNLPNARSVSQVKHRFREGQWRGCSLTDPQQNTTTCVDWATVYVEYLPRVYNYFRFRVGDDAMAEDLTAETFERAWRARTRYRRDLSAFATWLFAIARNVAAAHFRHDRTRLELPLDRAIALRDDPSIEEMVQRRSDLARLCTLLAYLPSRERELVQLKYGALLTNRVIASITGLSESNVGTLLHRIVRRLGAEWEGDEHERRHS